MKHLKHMFATCAFNIMSSCCWDGWRLVGSQSSMSARRSTSAWCGGCSGYDGCSARPERPHAGEGHDEQAGVVPAARCPCARERPQRKGIGRRWWERASRAGGAMSGNERRRLESVASGRLDALRKHYRFY